MRKAEAQKYPVSWEGHQVMENVFFCFSTALLCYSEIFKSGVTVDDVAKRLGGQGEPRGSL